MHKKKHHHEEHEEHVNHEAWVIPYADMLTLLMALSVFVLIALIGYELTHGSGIALRRFGVAVERQGWQRFTIARQ